jgi:hypothetical protein
MWNLEFGTHWSIWVWDWACSPFICSTGSDLAFDLPEVNYVGMAGSDQVCVDRKYNYLRCMVPGEAMLRTVCAMRYKSLVYRK